MSFLRKLLNKISQRKITLTFKTNARTAQFVKPIIEKLLLNDSVGETYRTSLVHWFHSPRPPINNYHGTESLVRIEGPLQWTSFWKAFPIGGIILAPGVTAHLNPIEADELDKRLKTSIEREVISWIAEHGLYDLPPVSEEIDLAMANREAMEIIAQWEAQECQKNPSNLVDMKGANDA